MTPFIILGACEDAEVIKTPCVPSRRAMPGAQEGYENNYMHKELVCAPREVRALWKDSRKTLNPVIDTEADSLKEGLTLG